MEAAGGLCPFIVLADVQFYIFNRLYQMFLDYPVRGMEHGIIVKDFRVFGKKKEDGDFKCF
jgi:hypothetical protein